MHHASINAPNAKTQCLTRSVRLSRFSVPYLLAAFSARVLDRIAGHVSGLATPPSAALCSSRMQCRSRVLLSSSCAGFKAGLGRRTTPVEWRPQFGIFGVRDPASPACCPHAATSQSAALLLLLQVSLCMHTFKLAPSSSPSVCQHAVSLVVSQSTLLPTGSGGHVTSKCPCFAAHTHIELCCLWPSFTPVLFGVPSGPMYPSLASHTTHAWPLHCNAGS